VQHASEATYEAALGPWFRWLIYEGNGVHVVDVQVRGQAEGGQSLLLSRVRTLDMISRLRQTAEARGGRLLSEVRGRRR
jgi:hypothetical protein